VRDGGKKEKISVGIDPWFSQKNEIFKKITFLIIDSWLVLS
jgi:hypothetical protein